MSIEVMKQALEALEELSQIARQDSTFTMKPAAFDVITSLRAAIAEAEREEEARLEQIMLDVWQDVGDPRLPGIKSKQNQCAEVCERAKLCAICARGLEDVQQEMEQEPVAWMYDWTTSEGEFIQNWTTSEAETLRDTEPTIISNVRPLYTHLPRREWAGLTIGELSDLYDKHAKCQEEGMLVSGWLDFATEHDALLKGRNT